MHLNSTSNINDLNKPFIKFEVCFTSKMLVKPIHSGIYKNSIGFNNIVLVILQDCNNAHNKYFTLGITSKDSKY